VPTISRFHGISIQMFFKEHGLPQFHARYGDRTGVFTVQPVARVRGELPRREERLVREWARLHSGELMRNWERARADQPLVPIPPLR
jgi:hypothetical protein